ncbi:MAG: 16S rRNA (uracil(1498)-N(3))-methyltransferase [Gemmataceae bacterium]|jgi:16S rRNA (uracil1498-N3)-methyltransferase|nr:16S rRNA (uracil(1498)-N(3))-methyltransferase [Gemmataceae bacterium]
MSRFFVETPPTLGEYVIDGPEAHHLGHVLRLQVGESITLFSGDGYEHFAHILEVNKRTVRCQIVRSQLVNRERPYSLHLAVAMPKGDRGDFLIEKLVELGVAEFTPLITERSVVKPESCKAEKFRRAVIEASKQCRRNILMKVHPPARWHDWVQTNFSVPKFVAHVSSEGMPPPPRLGNAVYAVGPEGGFSDKEIAAALQQGWQALSLGPTILRVETAALAIAAQCTA